MQNWTACKGIAGWCCLYYSALCRYPYMIILLVNIFARYFGSFGQLHIQGNCTFPLMQRARLPTKPLEYDFICELICACLQLLFWFFSSLFCFENLVANLDVISSFFWFKKSLYWFFKCLQFSCSYLFHHLDEV